MKQKNLSMYLNILDNLAPEELGLCPTLLAKRLKISTANLHFYIVKLLKDGYIIPGLRGRIKLYHITEPGLRELAKLRIKVCPSESMQTLIPNPSFDNLHNLSFKFNIKKHGFIWMANETQLNGMIKKYDWFKDDLITLYGGKDYYTSLEIRMRIMADSPHEAIWKAYQRAFRLADMIMDTYGIELGYPVINRKPHFTITNDRTIEDISQKQRIYTDIGHIDRSHDTGHLEYYNPELAKDYIKMPLTLAEVRNHQIEQQKQLNGMVGVLDDIRKDIKPREPEAPYKPQEPPSRVGYG